MGGWGKDYPVLPYLQDFSLRILVFLSIEYPKHSKSTTIPTIFSARETYQSVPHIEEAYALTPMPWDIGKIDIFCSPLQKMHN